MENILIHAYYYSEKLPWNQLIRYYYIKQH